MTGFINPRTGLTSCSHNWDLATSRSMPTAPAPLEEAERDGSHVPIRAYDVIDLADIAGLDFFGLPARELPFDLFCMASILGQEIPGNHQVVPIIGNSVFFQNLQFPIAGLASAAGEGRPQHGTYGHPSITVVCSGSGPGWG